MIDAITETRRDQEGEDGINRTVSHKGKIYDGSIRRYGSEHT